MHAKGCTAINLTYINGLQNIGRNRGDNMRRGIRNADRYVTRNVTSMIMSCGREQGHSFRIEGKYLLRLGIPVPCPRFQVFPSPSQYIDLVMDSGLANNRSTPERFLRFPSSIYFNDWGLIQDSRPDFGAVPATREERHEESGKSSPVFGVRSFSCSPAEHLRWVHVRTHTRGHRRVRALGR